MPIGDQVFGETTVTEIDLKPRYNDLIKEAIQKAAPDLEIVRADEVSFPGSISSDVITRIMHSDLVAADVTYPNSNVIYELGLRCQRRSKSAQIRRNKSAQIYKYLSPSVSLTQFLNSYAGVSPAFFVP